ncbi:MAG TPA: hypothetical protein VK859_08115 [bacterium]|jgi:hypothetical protein|nr:hypothetical protein [bacterium]
MVSFMIALIVVSGIASLPFIKKQGFRTAIIIVVTLLTMFLMAQLEVIHRAYNAYGRGEAHFQDKKYKEAMWDYQEVQEFYFLPHTHWVDLSAEKEFICRAYLGDWIPPEGPLDADVRTLRPDFAKYKDEVAQITPVGDSSYQPAPPTTLEKDMEKKAKKK